MTDDNHADAFDVLRRPDAPIAPSTTFTRRLLEQLTTELRPLLAVAPAATTQPTHRGHAMTVTPYFVVRNCAAALDFYRDAFGAVESHRLVGDDGRVGHAEIRIGDTALMLADEYPEVDALGPQSRGGPTCTFTIEVDDVDGAHAHTVALGARSLRPPADQFHGSRQATIEDPFGQRWTLSTLIENLSSDQYAARAAVDTGHGTFTLSAPVAGTADSHDHQVKHHAQGDLYYFTLPVRDLPRAQQFFTAVLGWHFGAPDNGHVDNISAPPGGVNDTSTDTGVRLWFVVDDIHAAVQRVRDLGGTADDPVQYDSGWSTDCTDDQGTMFSLSVPTYTIR